jgi:hypothetical protein
MKKNVLVFGLIAGFIVSIFMLLGMANCIDKNDYDHSMILGYTTMIIAFSFVFVGIKNYRDKYNGGLINFGQAFKTGLWITLIASTMYVVTWLIYYYFFVPDFMENYSAHMIEKAKAAGASAAEIENTMKEMAGYKEMYKNPLFVILFTYLEILPVGLLITVISALILKRKQKDPASIKMA